MEGTRGVGSAGQKAVVPGPFICRSWMKKIGRQPQSIGMSHVRRTNNGVLNRWPHQVRLNSCAEPLGHKEHSSHVHCADYLHPDLADEKPCYHGKEEKHQFVAIQ